MRAEWKIVDPSVKQLTSCDGELTINTALSCVVDEWKYHPGWSAVTLVAEQEGDQIRCRSLTRRSPEVMTEIYTYQNYDNSTFDLKPLRLAYYNLPEPVETPRESRFGSRYVWLLGLGLGALILAGLTRRFLRSPRLARA